MKGWPGTAIASCLPETWRGKHIRLCFDAVNYIAEVWINGAPAGCHEGGYTPFELPVTELLKLGEENLLVVRVVGPAVVRESVRPAGPRRVPHRRGAYVGGIWQPVRLEASDPLLVRDVFVEPKLEKPRPSAIPTGSNAPQPRQAEAEITIAPESARACRGASQARAATGTLVLTWKRSKRLPIPSPRAWSPRRRFFTRCAWP